MIRILINGLKYVFWYHIGGMVNYPNLSSQEGSLGCSMLPASPLPKCDLPSLLHDGILSSHALPMPGQSLALR